MHVAELWRYPVKSRKGEPLDEVEIRADGVVGDRLVHVRSASGRVITSRTRPRLLALRGELGEDGTPLIDGRPWHADESRIAVRLAAGEDADLVAYAGLERFDVLPLSIATDGAIAAIGVDRRRFRPNILIAGGGRSRRARMAGPTTAHWTGAHRRRSVAAAMRHDDVRPGYTRPRPLRRIVAVFDGALALDCSVIQPGHIRVGDRVEIVGREPA
jgi:uncharacterized protein YcbX